MATTKRWTQAWVQRCGYWGSKWNGKTIQRFNFPGDAKYITQTHIKDFLEGGVLLPFTMDKDNMVELIWNDRPKWYSPNYSSYLPHALFVSIHEAGKLSKIDKRKNRPIKDAEFKREDITYFIHAVDTSKPTRVRKIRKSERRVIPLPALKSK